MFVFSNEDKGQTPAILGKDNGGSGGGMAHNKQSHHLLLALNAERYDPKTERVHLVSIRDFERFLAGSSYEKLTPKDVGAYRDHWVKLRALSKKTGGLSNSTVRHRASHLAAFFKWLIGQSGYRRPSASIPDYFALPRCASAHPPSARFSINLRSLPNGRLGAASDNCRAMRSSDGRLCTCLWIERGGTDFTEH